MKTNFYKNLCTKDLSNNISESEKKMLIEWLDKSAQNKLEYEKLKKLWNSTTPSRLEYKIDIDEEWNNLANKISSEAEVHDTSSRPVLDFISSLFAPKLRPVWGMGAALVIIISSILFLNNYESEKILKTIKTANNQKLEVQLSDGTVVHLNSDSEIQFYENFEEESREIKLKGEAFFSVKKDGRTFIISTENATTTVLGTKFNVWSRDDETRVLVKEGKVSLADNTVLNNEVILNRGELSKVIESQPPEAPSIVDADYMLGWLNGRLIFENTSLSEIAKELERFYNVKVSLEDKELLNFNLSGSFDNEKIDSVLTKICLALNLKYVEKNNNFRITK